MIAVDEGTVVVGLSDMLVPLTGGRAEAVVMTVDVDVDGLGVVDVLGGGLRVVVDDTVMVSGSCELVEVAG
jgi:hypothetical protein